MAIITRIKDLREERGLTLEQLAERVEVSPGYLSRMERGKRPINSKWLERVARELNCSPSDLLRRRQRKAISSTVSVMVKASVQAGVYREALEWPEEEQYEISVPRHPKARNAFGLKVEGSSMNREFREGSYAVCVSIHDFWRDLKSGDIVVVHRRSPDGHTEGTLKQLIIDERGRAWLWPRSDDPEHQTPLSIPWPPRPADRDAPHPEIVIVAVAIAAHQILAE